MNNATTLAIAYRRIIPQAFIRLFFATDLPVQKGGDTYSNNLYKGKVCIQLS